MRIIIGILSVFIWQSMMAIDANNAFQKGNKYFEAQEYGKAIEAYDSLLMLDYRSWQLYYNIANAYYKTNQIGEAILHFERGLRLSPGNKDIEYNLALSKAKTVDKIEAIPEFFLSRFWKKAAATFHSDSWAIVFSLLFFMSCILFALFYATREKGVKKLTLSLSVLLFFMSLFFILLANKQLESEQRVDSAIVMSENEYIKFAPSESSKDAFMLHEGTKVSILDVLDEWCEIRIADGKRGWIPASSIEVI